MRGKRKTALFFTAAVPIICIILPFLHYFKQERQDPVHPDSVHSDSVCPDSVHPGSECFTSSSQPGGARQEAEAGRSIAIAGKEYSCPGGLESYLFIGTDGSGNESADGEAYQGSMADFLLLLVMDREAHAYGLLQLNRDTMAEITLLQKDGTGMASARLQLCTAHWYGGTKEQSSKNTARAVSALLGGMPISGYYTLNMEKIPALNHAAGGVEVMVEDDFTKIDPSMQPGRTVCLSDEQAYLFVHERYQVGDGENISRMRRQRQYLKAWAAKMQERCRETPGLVNQLYRSLKEDAVTDMNGNQISGIANGVLHAKNRGTYVPDGTLGIGQALGDGIGHVEFYMDEESLAAAMKQLYGLEERGRLDEGE